MAPPPRDCILAFGALRSGTTLLRLMLDGHPRLACRGETDFLFDHVYKGPDGPMVARDRLAEDRIFRNARLTLPERDIPLAEFVAAVLEEMAGGTDAIPMLMLHRNIAPCLEALPQARIVHILRDPRDVARSSIGMGWAGNVYFGADHWIATEREWADHAQTLEPRSYTLRYETLVAAPEQTLTALCTHVGLSYDPAMLTYPERTTYSAPDAGLAEQWRRKLSEEEVRLVEARVGPLLGATGYAPSGLPELKVTAGKEAALARQNRAFRMRTRIERNGLGLVLRELVSRKLGLKEMHRKARRQMAENMNRRIK